MIRCLCTVSFTALSALVWSAPPSMRDLVDPQPGQLCIYEGKTTVEQKTGARPVAEMANRVSLTLFVGAGARPEDRRVILTRTLAPSTSTVTLPPFSDVALYQLEPSLELALAGEPGTDPRLRVLDSQLPAEVFPAFALPTGETVEREDSVRVPAAAVAKLALVVKVSRSGDRATLSRSLAAGKTGRTDLDGQPATVAVWSEQIVCDTARKVVLEVRRDATLQGTHGGEPTEIKMHLELTAKEVRTLGAEEMAAMAKLEREVEGTLADLQAKKPPREVYERILAVSRERAARLLPGVDEALRAKLSYYRQEEDRSRRTAAASAASTLDKEAPDFTLEDLTGKKVNLREAVRGKVALLCFWYSTCPPCMKEAPYLTKLAEKYGDKGLAVIAVNARDESRAAVKAFVDSQGLKHQVLLNGQAVAQRQYRVLGYPSAFWIDDRGRIVEQVTGFQEEHYPEMEARVETLLLSARARKAAQGPGK